MQSSSYKSSRRCGSTGRRGEKELQSKKSQNYTQKNKEKKQKRKVERKKTRSLLKLKVSKTKGNNEI